ncbi:predicted protein [Histoplasma capsulatum H143]|uniref:Uncharacterized protein n=1 Tax=Ajellomyces capsulatus (strain H143) TaxID=544712 RepID=C6HR11_AJECH|nr:predicted protein [Histoplasma capsulatum H143]
MVKSISQRTLQSQSIRIPGSTTEYKRKCLGNHHLCLRMLLSLSLERGTSGDCSFLVLLWPRCCWHVRVLDSWVAIIDIVELTRQPGDKAPRDRVPVRSPSIFAWALWSESNAIAGAIRWRRNRPSHPGWGSQALIHQRRTESKIKFMSLPGGAKEISRGLLGDSC